MKVAELFEVEERSVLSVMGKQSEHISGSFSCSNNRLTTLEGGPSSVGDDFFCIDNKLTSLKGGPAYVGNSYVGNFYCNDNKITSLEGAPTSVGKYFVCSRNQLTSLHNIHKQIKHIGGVLYLNDNPITSCILGLLLIDGLKMVFLDNKQVQEIIKKHLKGERDVFACQEELIEAGLEDFAQL